MAGSKTTSREPLATDFLRFYYITDRRQFPGEDRERRQRLLDKITEAARSGVEYVQLREKDLSGRDLESLACEARERIRAARSGTRLLINSRADVALAVGADGIHLRSRDISPHDVRRIWREANATEGPVIAVSCHTEAEVVAAKQSGADFVVFGPAFEKSTAPDVQVTGLEGLRAVCRHNVPVFALGGITLTNARSCIASGATGIAGIRLFQENKVEDLAKRLRS